MLVKSIDSISFGRKQKELIFTIIFLILMFPLAVFSSVKEKIEPQPIGHFSVPTATQVGPLVSLGQIQVGKNALLPEFSGTYTKSHHGYTDVFLPNILYGILDELCIAAYIPFTPKSREKSFRSSGIEDIFLELEYAYFNKKAKNYALQATVVGDVAFPTGSSSKNPPTGYGSFSYLLGATFSYMSFNWYAFVSPGVQLTTKHHGTKFGNSYFYEWGFARYFECLSPKGWIFDLMVEFDGAYIEKNKNKGKINPDSGGNVIFVTPSVWLSSKRFILQWGIGFPLLQDLNGKQDKVLQSFSYNLAVSFQF